MTLDDLELLQGRLVGISRHFADLGTNSG